MDFLPGATTQTVRLAILDDLGAPTLEGPERLQLVLRVPVGASLGNPSVANVTINDSLSDCEFREFWCVFFVFYFCLWCVLFLSFLEGKGGEHVITFFFYYYFFFYEGRMGYTTVPFRGRAGGVILWSCKTGLVG